MVRTIAVAASALLVFTALGHAAETYKPIALADFVSTYKTQPPGTKVEITGYYERDDTAEVIVADPKARNSPTVILGIGDSQPKRKLLVGCSVQGDHLCRVTFRGRTCEASTKFPSDNSPCLNVDDILVPAP